MIDCGNNRGKLLSKCIFGIRVFQYNTTSDGLNHLNNFTFSFFPDTGYPVFFLEKPDTGYPV